MNGADLAVLVVPFLDGSSNRVEAGTDLEVLALSVVLPMSVWLLCYRCLLGCCFADVCLAVVLPMSVWLLCCRCLFDCCFTDVCLAVVLPTSV